MNDQVLPLPNPGDWVTIEGAARILGKSKQQVIRYVADQRIRGYRLEGARERLADRVLWKPEVLEFKRAAATFRRPNVAEQVARRAQMATTR